MDKRLAFALGVSTILGNVESVYARDQQGATEEIKKIQIRPSRSLMTPKKDALKLSVRFKDDKIKGSSNTTGPSSKSGLTTKKLSRKEARAARRNLALALKASKQSALNAMIATKRQVKIGSKRHKKLALKIAKLETQQARLQQIKNLLIAKLPETLNRQKLPKKISLNPRVISVVENKSLETVRNIPAPTIFLPLHGSEVKVSQGSVHAHQEESSSTGGLQANEIHNPLVTSDVENKNLENVSNISSSNVLSLDLSEVKVSQGSVSAHQEELSSTGGLQANSSEGIQEIDVSAKSSTLQELDSNELNSETLRPFFHEASKKVWNLLESSSGKDITEVINEIKNAADTLVAVAQIFDPARRATTSDLEGGYVWDSLIDENTNSNLNNNHQTQQGETSSEVDKDLKKTPLPIIEETDDLKKANTITPPVNEEPPFDMDAHNAKIESLEKAISQFQYAAYQLREKVEIGGSNDIEAKKVNFRELLTEAFKIEKNLSSLQLRTSDSNAETVNSLLKKHEDSISSQKKRLSESLQKLMNIEAKNDLTPVPSSQSLHSIPSPQDEEKDKVIRETESATPGVSNLVATDSDEPSKASFPSALGSLKDLLVPLIERTDLESQMLTFEQEHIKMYSAWLKTKLLEMEVGGVNADSNKSSSISEESYSFTADMKDLHAKVLNYLNLPTDSLKNDPWLVNFNIESGKRYVGMITNNIIELTRKLEEQRLDTRDTVSMDNVAEVITPSSTTTTPQAIENAKNEDQVVVPSSTTTSPQQQSQTPVVSNQEQSKRVQWSIWDYLPPYSSSKPTTTLDNVTPGNDNNSIANNVNNNNNKENNEK